MIKLIPKKENGLAWRDDCSLCWVIEVNFGLGRNNYPGLNYKNPEIGLGIPTSSAKFDNLFFFKNEDEPRLY